MVIQDTLRNGQDILLKQGVAGVTDAGMDWVQRMPPEHPAWFFVWVLILLSFFAWIRSYYGNTLLGTLQAALNYQASGRMFLDNSVLQRQLDSILYLFYILSTGFALFAFENRFQRYPFELEGIKLYLFNIGLLASLFFIRVLLLNLSGFLFNRLRIFREYLYNINLYNRLLGIVLLPTFLFAFYTKGILRDVVFWTIGGLILVVIIMRIVRGLVFSFKKDISIFYMFLYLCALEIVPLALLYKWLQGTL